MSSPASIPELIGGLFWPPHPIGQAAILMLLAFAALVGAAVYAPLLLRLFQIGSLQRSVQACFDEEDSNAVQRQEVGNAFSESPLAYQWSDFVRRWHNAIAADPVQNASLPELSRAPVRLMDVLEEHPILPAGSRRSLLPSLPAVFLSAGLLGAFAGLVLALPGIGLSLDPPAFESTHRSQQVGALMEYLGMALHIGLWGLLLSLGAALTGRFIEGRSEGLAESLDGWVQLAYGAISAGELATRTAHEQRAAISRLEEDLGELLRQVSGRPRPLVRSTAAVPGSAAPAGNVDPEALERAVRTLGEQLGERLDRTVAEQLAALRESLGDAIEGLSGRSSGAPSELREAVQQLVRSSGTQEAAGRSLTQTAHTVADAAEELRAGLDDFAGVVTTMRETSEALRLAANRVDGGQTGSARAAERLTASLDRLEREADGRREQLDARLEDLAQTIAELADRLGQRPEPARPAAAGANVREAAGPAPAPERKEEREEKGYATIDRDRAPRPAHSGSATPPRPAHASEADTIPYMKAPSPEMIRAARESRTAPSPPAAPPSPPAAPPSPPPATRPSPAPEQGPSGGRGTLSGLLRPTHHSGPSSGPGPAPSPARNEFDPAATVALDDFERRAARPGSETSTGARANDEDPDVAAEPGTGHEGGPEDDGSRRRSGFFGRRK